MLLRSKIGALATITFWLLSVGKVVEGKLGYGESSEISAKSVTVSRETTNTQGSAKKSLNYIPDKGGGTAYDDFEEDDEDDHIHRDVFKHNVLPYIITAYFT